jgi:hypothetical protein
LQFSVNPFADAAVDTAASALGASPVLAAVQAAHFQR